MSNNPAETTKEKPPGPPGIPVLARITLVPGKNGSGKTHFLRQVSRADGVSPGRPAPHLQLGPGAVSPERLVQLWDKAGPGTTPRPPSGRYQANRYRPCGSAAGHISPPGSRPQSRDRQPAPSTSTPWEQGPHGPSPSTWPWDAPSTRSSPSTGSNTGCTTPSWKGCGRTSSAPPKRRTCASSQPPTAGTPSPPWARAAAAEQDQDVMLVRLERGAGPPSAVTYSGDELLTAARQGIEVR